MENISVSRAYKFVTAILTNTWVIAVEWLGTSLPLKCPKDLSTNKDWNPAKIVLKKGKNEHFSLPLLSSQKFPFIQIEYPWIHRWAVFNPLWSYIFLLLAKVFPDKFVEREILLLELHCSRLDKGCQWKGKIKYRQVFVRQYFQWFLIACLHFMFI